MNKTLVLGLGNDLYGDDGVGIHIIQCIKEKPELKDELSALCESVEFKPCCQSGLSLLDVITGYDSLIIIDTIKKSNPSTGKTHTLEGKDLRYIPGPSPHYVSIPQSIEIGKKLGLKVPTIVKVIAIEAKNMYKLGENMTEEMKKKIPVILEKLKSQLKEIPK
ncbi:MAG: hydrogenase maturation protease [Candidatus Aminicenantes bacterium]|nr:hydrogenase maturation protease [Candidatus Aminicenantes bacterium]